MYTTSGRNGHLYAVMKQGTNNLITSLGIGYFEVRVAYSVLILFLHV